MTSMVSATLATWTLWWIICSLLHRVTRVSGTCPRLVPVLSYAERPGLANSEPVRKLFWGRTGANNG